jgi:hypothetical protein
MNPNRFTDSAGVPWQGRAFEANPFADDDGSANPNLIQAIHEFHKTADPARVFAEFAKSRLLIPLVANLGESEIGAHGKQVDKSAELSIVTVQTPDAAAGLPVFSSVQAMAAWNPDARPVPADAVRVALAAASEGNTRIILDPTSDSEYVFRRPAIAAMAQGFEWIAPHLDRDLLTAIAEKSSQEPAVVAIDFYTEDSRSRLLGAELVVRLTIAAGLSQQELNSTIESVAERISQIPDLNDRVDQLKIVVKSAG